MKNLLENDYIFVYGTLRKHFRKDTSSLINEVNSVFIGNGYVNGILYNIGSYPGAIFSNNPKFRVYGEVYKFKKDYLDEIKKLDSYERFKKCDVENSEFLRLLTSVYISNTTLLSWIYWYNFPTHGKALISSGDYLSI